MHGGQAALAAIVLVPLAFLLLGIIGRAARVHGGNGAPKPGATKAGFASGWLDHRRKLRLERVRSENQQARDQARHLRNLERDRLRDERKAAQAAAAGTQYTSYPGAPGSGPGDPGGFGPGAPRWRATVIRVWPAPASWRPWSDGTGRLRLPFGWHAAPAAPGTPGAPDAPAAPGQPPATAGTPRAPGPASPAAGTPPPAPQPPARDGITPSSSPPRPVPGLTPPAASQPEPRTIEGVVVTVQPEGAIGLPGLEMIIEGCDALRRHAMSGNARAKRQGILGIAAAGDALGRTARSLAAQMSEPGQHYGHEITEPLAMAGSHFSVGAMEITEVDGRLRAIIRAAEELRASGVQAPHHDQLAEQ